MSFAELTVQDWNALTDQGAGHLAASIAVEHDLRLVTVQAHEFAGRSHRVALFSRDGVVLALVPGGRVRLGFDGSQFAPSVEQTASFADSAEEYGLPPVHEFVDAMTSPSRVVELPAMLVGVEAMDACAAWLAADDPRVLELLAKSRPRPGGGIRSLSADGGVEVNLDQVGNVASARLIRQVSYQEAVREVEAGGLRPSTPDEWEYACGAGAETLFRWGDRSLDDGYPYDHRTGPHREQNLWGLAIGQDPYRHEWTSQAGVVCGGDGGGATCGGSGFFLGWLTLATAYRDTEFGMWVASDDGYKDQILIRPILDL